MRGGGGGGGGIKVTKGVFIILTKNIIKLPLTMSVHILSVAELGPTLFLAVRLTQTLLHEHISPSLSVTRYSVSVPPMFIFVMRKVVPLVFKYSTSAV